MLEKDRPRSGRMPAAQAAWGAGAVGGLRALSVIERSPNHQHSDHRGCPRKLAAPWWLARAAAAAGSARMSVSQSDIQDRNPQSIAFSITVWRRPLVAQAFRPANGRRQP